MMKVSLTLGVLLALVASSQVFAECNVDLSEYIVKGNFARKKSNCFEAYYCVNGNPILIGDCRNLGDNLFYSVEIGQCTWNSFGPLKMGFDTDNCALEIEKYENNDLKDRRDLVCQNFEAKYAGDDKRLYSGDLDNCQWYFNCRVPNDFEWHHKCPGGTFFNEDTGICDMLAYDSAKCNSQSRMSG